MMRRLAGVAAVQVAVVLVVLAASCCEARVFYVGGRDGWTTSPAEPYNRWAERNRFQVNDSLVFRYSQEKDAVLLVSQSHYDACNVTEPLLRDGGGNSTFVFDNSGPFFFISGDPGRCQAGERLIVVVLAVRNNATTSPTTPSPPASSPPTVPAPTPRSSPPPPAAGTNGTAPAPPVPAPAPRSPPSPAGGNFTAPAPGTNGTASPPRPSSASSTRGGALLMLLVVISGATSLV
ncbi:hypothetical protein E2562_000577 [Oryza meyeriana var. granulata]|uniref:Phytocyanin domain-containing protein n=1 Tax=Oryza meyeriana var. granulata TaxID=110450 RepID=A0A6G1DTI2_9ORYZ|nr:hypothetical protein E2562_000577 [Oryza meyeriana var. granulata]